MSFRIAISRSTCRGRAARVRPGRGAQSLPLCAPVSRTALPEGPARPPLASGRGRGRVPRARGRPVHGGDLGRQWREPAPWPGARLSLLPQDQAAQHVAPAPGPSPVLTFISTDSLSFSRLTILMATFWQVTQ